MANVRTKKTRFVIGAVLGLLAAAVIGWLSRWEYAVLGGWDVFMIVIIGMIWYDFTGHSPSETAAIACRDDKDHSLLDTVVLTASLVSIAAVTLLIASHDTQMGRFLFGLGSIIVSWIGVHTLYTLRYAAQYYRGDEGGIDFNTKARPRFSDFAYLAFTIGMTYQVSDTSIASHEIRRVALGHALTSFIFGVAIIATTINFLASLSQ